MFLAHLPAGYLVSRALVRGGEQPGVKWALAAGMAGGVFPDLDLLYLHLVDATPQHHHTYWTHLPVAWLGLSTLAWIAARKRSAAFRLALAAFLLAWLSHLLLDTVTGDIWWLYPLVDTPYSLVTVEARYQPWWMNFLLHWSMALEFAIIGLAVWLARERLPLRFRVSRLAAAAVTGFIGLMLIESYLPPALHQPVLGASARDWHPVLVLASPLGKFRRAQGHRHFRPARNPGGGGTGWPRGLPRGDQTGRPGGPGAVAARLAALLRASRQHHGEACRLGRSGRGDRQRGKHRQCAGQAAAPALSILSPIPRLLAFRAVEQGWKRVFYRNPDALLRRQPV
ncbi:MAG TPA: metal-dependent hydrolase [Steroidobacteraceae bacterium]|nr:metal-dependent hydrolase [Steroidobacteraceae bacterium]